MKPTSESSETSPTTSEPNHASGAANEKSPAFPTLKSVNVAVSGNGLNDRGESISDPTVGATPLPTVDIDKILGRKVFTTLRRLNLRYYRRLLFFKLVNTTRKARDLLLECP